MNKNTQKQKKTATKNTAQKGVITNGRKNCNRF